jgi:hypothetical protein
MQACLQRIRAVTLGATRIRIKRRLRRPEIRSRQASGFGLQASGGQTMSTEDHAELAAWYGELTRGLQRLLAALRPDA